MEMETTGTENTEVNESIVNEAIATEETVNPETEITETTNEEIPSYEPTFKFRVRDDEHEMEEWVKDFIKDEDTEKKFQDLFTRGHGLELIKGERDEYKGKYTDLESAVEQVAQLAQRGEIEQFITQLGLPKKAFIDYAIKELQFQELPPEQQQQINAQRQREQQFQQTQIQAQTYEQQWQEAQVQMRRMELNNTLMQPQYAEAARVYDESVGTPGAFNNLVQERGYYHSQMYGKDISVEEAIQDAMRIGRVSGTAPLQTGNGVGTQANPVQNQASKPVIPKMKAGGASPIKKTITSVDDLRKYASNRG